MFVRLNEADFGLVAGNGNVAFELSNGSFEAGIDGLAGISADEVIVQYTNATTTAAEGTSVAVLDPNTRSRAESRPTDRLRGEGLRGERGGLRLAFR